MQHELDAGRELAAEQRAELQQLRGELIPAGRPAAVAATQAAAGIAAEEAGAASRAQQQLPPIISLKAGGGRVPAWRKAVMRRIVNTGRVDPSLFSICTGLFYTYFTGKAVPEEEVPHARAAHNALELLGAIDDTLAAERHAADGHGVYVLTDTGASKGHKRFHVVDGLHVMFGVTWDTTTRRPRVEPMGLRVLPRSDAKSTNTVVCAAFEYAGFRFSKLAGVGGDHTGHAGDERDLRADLEAGRARATGAAVLCTFRGGSRWSPAARGSSASPQPSCTESTASPKAAM